MKKILFIAFILLTLASCKKKDYAEVNIEFEGLKPTDTVLSLMGMGFNRKIDINDNGQFNDTLKLKKGTFVTFFLDRERFFQAFLNNDFNLNVTGDASRLDSTLVISGKGANNSIYLQSRIKNVTEFGQSLELLYAKDSLEFYETLDAFQVKMSDMLKAEKKLDTALINFETKGLKDYLEMIKRSYPQRHAVLVKFGKGKPSPTFEQLRNYKGGTTSLNDFKGKFVYIDLWATWCKPCLVEIPALKTIEEEYRGKNIEFVSISTDKEKDYNKWKTMVKEKELSGVQLFAGDDNQFAIDYDVRSIPRFIFIDTEGNIYNANAPRPTATEQIKKMFEEAGVQ